MEGTKRYRYIGKPTLTRGDFGERVEVVHESRGECFVWDSTVGFMHWGTWEGAVEDGLVGDPVKRNTSKDKIMNTPYVAGRLFAALVLFGAAKETDFVGELSVVGDGLNRINRDKVSSIVEVLPADSLHGKLSKVEEGNFWVGYYHQRKDWRETKTISPDRIRHDS